MPLQLIRGGLSTSGDSEQVHYWVNFFIEDLSEEDEFACVNTFTKFFETLRGTCECAEFTESNELEKTYEFGFAGIFAFSSELEFKLFYRKLLRNLRKELRHYYSMWVDYHIVGKENSYYSERWLEQSIELLADYDKRSEKLLLVVQPSERLTPDIQGLIPVDEWVEI